MAKVDTFLDQQNGICCCGICRVQAQSYKVSSNVVGQALLFFHPTFRQSMLRCMRLIAPTRVLGSKGRPAQQPYDEQRRGPHCPSERHPLVRGERRGPGLLPPRGARQPRDDPQAQHAAQDGADDAGGVGRDLRIFWLHRIFVED